MPAVSPARACAYTVVRRVFERGAWADRTLHAEAARRRLDARDRALATRLTYGTVQRLATLDHLIEVLAGRPAERLEPVVRAVLRLGLFQLAFLDRVPAHAAVGESVEMVKADAPKAAGLVNAVLRRASREAAALVAALPDATPTQAALRHSHPEWIAALWWEHLGAAEARACLAADNEPAEAALRVNTLRGSREDLLERIPGARPVDGLPEGIVLTEPFDAFGSPLHAEGRFMPQSRAAMAVARLVDPQPGERVLDLCAAPGGKTTHLAQLMGDRGEVHAVEAHEGRAEALRRTAGRMGTRSVRVHTLDARRIAGEFDRVLVDPPCSDLGTLASRPDARWRKQPGDLPRLARLQGQILRAAAGAVRPGGVLVYSTCTISPRENERLLDAFLRERPEFAVDPERPADLPVWEHPTVPSHLQTLPHRDGTEGFFLTRLRREDAG